MSRLFNFQRFAVDGITSSALLGFCTLLKIVNEVKLMSETGSITGPIVETELQHMMTAGLWNQWEEGQLARTSTGRFWYPQYLFNAIDPQTDIVLTQIIMGFLSAAVKCGCKTVCFTFPERLKQATEKEVKRFCMVVLQAILLFFESTMLAQITSIGFSTENNMVVKCLEELIQLCNVRKFSKLAARKGRRRLEKKYGKEEAKDLISGFHSFVRFRRTTQWQNAPLVTLFEKMGFKKTKIVRHELLPFAKLTVQGKRGGAKKMTNSSAALREQYGPPGAVGQSLFVLGQDDIDEVLAANTMISNTALFRLLFEKVAEFNASRLNHQKVCLLHPDFFVQWTTAASPAARRRAFQTWASYTVGTGNKWFLVPILQHGHFLLVQIGIIEDGQCSVHVFDSLAAPGTPARLNYNDLRELATFLIPGALDSRVQFAVAGEDIFLQRNNFDCGIHTAMNAWACLTGDTIINDVRDIDGRRLRLGPGPAKRQVDLARKMFGEQLQRMLAAEGGQAPPTRKRADNVSRSASVGPIKKRTRIEQPKENPEIIINSSPEMEVDDSDCQIISDDEEHALLAQEPKRKTTRTESKMETMNAAKKTKKTVDNARKNSIRSRIPSRTPNRDQEPETKKDPRALNASIGTAASIKKRRSVEMGGEIRQQQVRDEAKKFPAWGGHTERDALSMETMIQIVENLNQFVVAEVKNVVRHIKGMLDFKVANSKSTEDRKMRQLVRIRFHLFSNDGKDYAPVQDVYYAIWKVFMGYVDPAGSTEDADVAMEVLRDHEVAPELPRDLNEEIQLHMEDLYGRPLEQARLDSDKPTVDSTRHITKARPCDVDCPEFDENEAARIHEQLAKVISTPLERMDADLSKLPFGEENVRTWLNLRAPCSQGIRSMMKRFRELARLLSVYHASGAAVRDQDREKLKDLLKLECLPDRLREVFSMKFMPRRPEGHHTQHAVENRFGSIYKKFEVDMENQETTTCQVCFQLTADKDVQLRSVDSIAVGLDDETVEKGGRVRCCQMCWKAMRPGRNQQGGKVPQAARINGFEVDYVPNCLRRLNYMEQMLIEKTRAVQRIIHLKTVDKSRKTGMKGTNGVLVLLPTEIEATVDHVGNTLPSASNMTISVRTGWEMQYQVSMPKVVAALKWLKKNNPEYHDININERFGFTIGKNIFFQDPDATQEDADKLVIECEKDDGHILTQDLEFQPLRTVDQQATDEMPHEQYALKRHRYAPLSVDTPNVDLQVFPHLHPKGRGGMSADRMTLLQFSKYIRTRILNEDRRWATSAQWMCMMFALKLQKAITSVQGIRARLGAFATGNDFDPEDPKTQDSLSCAFRKVRGFSQYWQSAKYCLRAHAATFGTPTWFVTLNPDIWHWTELHELYGTLLSADVHGKNIEEEICKDPVPFARFWRRKLKAFLKNVILAKNGPLGTVTHYFYRIEYQHRGTQHVHAIFWTTERPAADAGADEVTAFLDRHVTARKPDKEKEPELFELVDRCQQHYQTHSATCRREERYKGKPYEKCRFGFPRPILQRTLFFTDKNDYVMPTHCQRPYYLARRATETYTNDYNPALLLGWKANIDVQYIPANVKDVMSYVTAYTTKGEKAKRLADKESDRYGMEGLPLSKQLFRQGMKMLESREAGLLEIVDDLMGHHNFQFDCGHEFIPTDKSENRTRMVKPKARIEKNKTIYEDNWIDTYYPSRGEKFAEYSLYNMMTQFEVNTVKDDVVKAREAKKAKKATKKTKKQPAKSLEEELIDDVEYRGSDEEEESADELNEGVSCAVPIAEYHTNEKASPFFCHPQIDAGDLFRVGEIRGKAFRKRKPVIGRFFFGSVMWENKESIEEFYRRVVLLFVPWTCEGTILEDYDAETYTDLWAEWISELKETRPDAAADIEKLLDAYRDLKKEEEMMGRRIEAVRRVMEQLQIEENAEPEAEIQDRQVDVDLHEQNKNNMNTVQKRIFGRFMKHIARQEEVRRWNRDHDAAEMEEVPEPIAMFLSGTAGTGKSFLIRNLADALTLEYTKPGQSGRRPAVLLAAPTGIAALAIGGNTVHSLFKIEVNTDGERELKPLSQRDLDQCRMLCSNTKLIIIDEISMCSNVMLMKLHRRLVQISGNRNSMFGGYNILLMGDLLQLPPVRAPQVFQKISGRSLRESFGTVNFNLNLWSHVEYEELTENMRQRGDKAMAGMLGRMRVGGLNGDDIKLLESRVMGAQSGAEPTFAEIAEKFVEIQKQDPRVMALFPTNAEVITMNKAIVDLIQLDCVTFEAEDSVDESAARSLRNANNNVAGKQQKIWQRLPISEPKGRPGQQKKKKDGRTDEMVLSKQSIQDKIHGGLPAKVVLAVGARVMLRRNINVTRRLVNGATGIVKSIDPQSEWIQVEFDAEVPFLHYIRKMEARYQRGAQEVMLRRQFPLVLAYAATIHKAQGMTLKNVIVRSLNIFTDSMFFVAASRVTSLGGLHLAGLNVAAACKVNKPALQEYNRLRVSIGLEEVGNEPEDEAVADAVETQRKNRNDRPEAQLFITTPKAPPPKRRGSKQEDQQQQKRQGRAQRVAYEKILNDQELLMCMPHLVPTEMLDDAPADDLAFRAALFTLSMMEFVCDAMLNGNPDADGDITGFNAIHACLLGLHRNVWQVVDEMKKNRDLWEVIQWPPFRRAFEAIFRTLPRHVRAMLGPYQLATIRCRKCKTTREDRRPHNPVIYINKQDITGHLADAINAVFGKWRPSRNNCEQCGGQTDWSFEGDSSRVSHKYLVAVQLSEHSSYRAVPKDPVCIDKHRYLLVGAIRFKSDDGTPEYWYRSPTTGWLLAKDGHDDAVEVSGIQLENFNVFVWVKKEAQRVTKRSKETGRDVETVLDQFEDLWSRRQDSDGLDDGQETDGSDEGQEMDNSDFAQETDSDS